MAGENPGSKKLDAEMDIIERAANHLHDRSENLVEDAEQFQSELEAAVDHGIRPGSQEDVFLRSIPIWEQQRRPGQEEYVHMLADLISDDQVVFYCCGQNITPWRIICDVRQSYLEATERGYDNFKREVKQGVPRNTRFPGMCITGIGIEHLFSNHQNMLHTAALLFAWSDITPIHIDYDLAAFRALDYDASPAFPFSLFTSSIAEQRWHMKMMLERNGGYARTWTPDIEQHRIAYWENVRDFPIGNHHTLAKLRDEARFQLKMYPGLLEDVLCSLAQASVHAPK